MNTFTAPSSSSNTAPMPPTSDPLKLFLEEIEKTPQSIASKFKKIQAYILTLHQDKYMIKDLNVPMCKQILDHAIKTLQVEFEKVFAQIMDRVKNGEGITDVDVSPEEMISVFENLSLTPTNTVVQPAPASPNATSNTVVQMQQRALLERQRLLHTQMLMQTQPAPANANATINTDVQMQQRALLIEQQRLQHMQMLKQQQQNAISQQMQVQMMQALRGSGQQGSIEQQRTSLPLQRLRQQQLQQMQEVQMMQPLRGLGQQGSIEQQRTSLPLQRLRSLQLQQGLVQQRQQQLQLQLQRGLMQQESQQIQKLRQKLVHYQKKQQKVFLKLRKELREQRSV